jgi:hypothetical protein
MQHAFQFSFVIALMCSSVAIAGDVANEPAKLEAELSKESTTYDLRYKFKRGEFLHYETESSSTMTVQASQFKQVLKETRQTQKHLRVVTVDSQGNVVLEPVLDHVVMSAQADNGRPLVFDSESKTRVPKRFAEVAAIVGKSIVRVRYKPNGKMDEVLPIPGLEDKLPKDESTHAFLVVLPDEPVAVGASWNDDFDVMVSITRTLHKKITIRRRYAFEKVDGGIAQITFRTYPISVVKEPQLQAQLIQRSLSGRVKFDIDQGKIVEWSSRGNGQVFNAFGPTSAMKATSKSIEKYVAKPRSRDVIKAPATPQRKQLGPVGPPLPSKS